MSATVEQGRVEETTVEASEVLEGMDGVLDKILTRLSPIDLCAARCVSRGFRRAAGRALRQFPRWGGASSTQA